MSRETTSCTGWTRACRTLGTLRRTKSNERVARAHPHATFETMSRAAVSAAHEDLLAVPEPEC